MVPGLHIMPVSDEEQVYQLLNEAQANRAVAEHQLNTKSSRSHVIYTYYITRTKLAEEASSDAEGNFVSSNIFQFLILDNNNVYQFLTYVFYFLQLFQFVMKFIS